MLQKQSRKVASVGRSLRLAFAKHGVLRATAAILAAQKLQTSNRPLGHLNVLSLMFKKIIYLLKICLCCLLYFFFNSKRFEVLTDV